MGTLKEEPACMVEQSFTSLLEQEQDQYEDQDELQQLTSAHVYADWAALQAYFGPKLDVPHYFNLSVASPHGLPHVKDDYPSMSSGDFDRGLVKKSKGSDWFAESVGPGNGDDVKDIRMSCSGETRGSNEGSNGKTTKGGQAGAKRSCKLSPITRGASSKRRGVTVASAKVSGKVRGLLSPNPTTQPKKERYRIAAANMASRIRTQRPNEAFLHLDERELKRETKKQINREASTRSRMKQQAGVKMLAAKVEALSSENLSLRSEIDRLIHESEKLKLQNAKLMEKLNNKEKKKQVTEDPVEGSSLQS